MSSVVGLSIPAASAIVQDPALRVSLTRRSELVRWLTSGPIVGHLATPATSYAGSAAASITSSANVAAPPTMKMHPRRLSTRRHVFRQFGFAGYVVSAAFHGVFDEF